MDDALEQEFFACLHRAGVSVPPDRLDAMRAAFLGYRELAAILDEKLPYAVEPAAVYVPESAP